MNLLWTPTLCTDYLNFDNDEDEDDSLFAWIVFVCYCSLYSCTYCFHMRTDYSPDLLIINIPQGNTVCFKEIYPKDTYFILEHLFDNMWQLILKCVHNL